MCLPQPDSCVRLPAYNVPAPTLSGLWPVPTVHWPWAKRPHPTTEWEPVAHTLRPLSLSGGREPHTGTEWMRRGHHSVQECVLCVKCGVQDVIGCGGARQERDDDALLVGRDGLISMEAVEIMS